MWTKIRGYFLTGLIAVLPLVITIWLLYQVFLFVDSKLVIIVRPIIEPLKLPLPWLWMGKGLTLWKNLFFWPNKAFDT